MNIEEMIKELKEQGYSVYPPLTERQNRQADKCAESGYGDCSECSCCVCLAGCE